MMQKIKAYLDRISALLHKEQKSHTAEKTTEVSFTPHDLFQSLGVEVVGDDGADQYMVGFQGGYFRFNFSKTHISIIYPNFSSCKHGDTVKAVLIANKLNCKYLGWTCYLSVNEMDTQGKPVDLCMSCLLSRTGTLADKTEYVKNMLLVAFSVAREYRDDFEQAKKDHTSLDEYFEKRDFNHKLAMLARMAEVGIDSREDGDKEDAPLTIDSIVSGMDTTTLGCMTGLRVIAGDDIKTLSDPSAIRDFDIRLFIQHHEKREELNTLLFWVAFEKQSLLIHLKKTEGSTDKCYFYLMQVSRTGVMADLPEWTDDSLSILTTIAVRLTTEQEDFWEVKYMLDDAKEKQQAGNENELTDEQRVMLDQLAPSLYSDAYWGRKFFGKGCMVQALFYFKRIYASITASAGSENTASSVELEYAFYLGVVYLQLKNYEKAYYYLQKAKDSNKVIVLQYYVLCRNFLKDPSVESYISGLLISLVEELYTSAEPDTVLVNFYSFLNRQLVYAMENNKSWKRAEQHLQRMLDRNQDVEFVKKELARIKELRTDSDHSKSAGK